MNTVNPDAVLEGSRIWDSAWREERARAYGIAADELEAFYRERTTLKVNVLPADIAAAILFFASPRRSGKSTGNILNVDGGVALRLPPLTVACAIALFVTCVGDTIFPEAGKAIVRLLERLGHEVEFPSAQTCCGQLHANSGYRGEATALARRFVRVFERLRRDRLLRRRRASGWCGRSIRARARATRLRARCAASSRASSSSPSSSSNRLGVDRRRRIASRTASPTTRPATRCGCSASGTAPLRLLRAVRGPRARRAAERRRVLRLRRHVRGQERRHVGGDGRRQVPRRSSRPAPRSARPSTARACCRSAAASRARARGVRTLHLAEILAATGDGERDAGVPGGRARGARRRAAARATCARPRTTIRDKRARVVAEVPDWEELREAGRAIKAADARAPRRVPDRSSRPRSTAAGGQVHWARDAAEANRIVARDRRGPRRHRGRQGQVARRPTRSGSTTRSRRRASHAIETDLAELILQLDGDWSSHILVPAIHRNRTEIRDIFRRTIADATIARRPARARRGGAAVPAREVPARAGGGQRRELRRRRDGHRLRRRVRGQRPHVHDAAAGARHDPRASRSSCRPSPTSRSSCSCCRAPSTGERMNPYTSLWTGVTPGDGPQEFHVVLLDDGRTRVLADEVGRQALHCIRCSACLNVCPVY